MSTTNRPGIALYGPPSSGKDAVTETLHYLYPRFVLLPELKVSAERTNGYELISPERRDKLRAEGRLAVDSHRGDTAYAIDQQTIETLQSMRCIPIVHLHSISDLRQLMEYVGDTWLRVLLWVSRDVAEERALERSGADVPSCLAAWDETRADLDSHDEEHLFHLRVHTDRISIHKAAQKIIDLYASPQPG
jgi:guanylate kinase